MFTINPLLQVDSYKISHKDQYPEGLEKVYSNYTNRGSRIPEIQHVVLFGLQAYLKKLTEDYDQFFATPKEVVMDDYKHSTSTFVTPGFSVKELEDLHDLGYLPVQFNALPEGTLVPIKVPSLTLESTHKDFAWVVNYLESHLSASIWHTQTVATMAWDMRRSIVDAAKRTTDGDPWEATNFSLHDFSYRGQTSPESAMASGAAHLLSSLGTDGVPSVPWVEYYYPGEDNGLIAASVPATEHSVMCAGGKESEIDTFNRLLDTYPEGILSVVSDTWNFFGVLTNHLPKLKDRIMARDGKLVIRPDSGNPADIICGTLTTKAMNAKEVVGYSEPTPEEKGAIELLWDLFGGTTNSKGYKELDSHIGLIYGDGMNRDTIKEINDRLEAKGFASTNWVSGVGSFAYTYVTRDTFGSAVKATQVTIDGVETPIFKDPATDTNKLKKSLKGLLSVLLEDGDLVVHEEATTDQMFESYLSPVWKDGKFLRTQSFNDVRETLKKNTERLTKAGKI